MYVRWKVLIGLGTAFWVLLCLVDYLPIKQMDYLVLQRQQPLKIERKEPPPVLKEPTPDEGHLGFIKALLWNLLAFGSTIVICFLLKTISNKVNIINKQALMLEHHDKLAAKKTSSSRIPIPVSYKTSSTDIHLDDPRAGTEDGRESEHNKSCPNLTISQDVNDGIKMESKNDKIRSIKVMEKHCARLREEMLNLEAVSLKERSAIGKKMEALLKEKRELIKQANTMSKENKSLKMQIDEMLEERQLLIKRLECATKEMKNATRNKKATVAKLDEAVSNAESLKSNLERIKRDKSGLEDKIIVLDAEYRRLKGEVELYKRREDNTPEIERHAVTQTSDYNVSNSDDDIKKVQQKLLKLEKSLENFKLRHGSTEEEATIGDSKEIPEEAAPDEVKISPKASLKGDNSDVPGEVPEIAAPKPQENDGGDESSPSIAGTSEDSEVPTVCIYSESNSKGSLDKKNSSNSICTEPDCPLEHKECNRAECFLRRKLLERTAAPRPSREDMVPLTKLKDYSIDNKKVSKLKSSISDDRLSIISELATSTAEESGEDCSEPKRRFVTHSPAFQKFLKEALDASSSKISVDLTK